jgi:WD40 repeat protein
MTRRGRLFVVALALIISFVPLTADEPKTPTAEAVQKLQADYKAEREAAAKQGFTAAQLERADRIAARAQLALNNGQTRDAAGLFREARWLVPVQPAELPANVSRVFGYPRLRHGDVVTGLAYTADGRQLVTSSKDGTVKIWDLANGRELRAYRDHHDAVRAVAVAPNGKFIVSAAGNEIHVWNPADGKLIRKLKGHSKPVNCLAVRPDSKAIASGADDQSVKIWDADSDKILR